MSGVIIEYTPATDLSIIADAEVLPKGRKKRGAFPYLNLICAFDIETTNVPELKRSFMYIWQLQIEDLTIIGRQWSDFQSCINRINELLTEREAGLVIWVHNLSFEFMYLKSWIPIENLRAMDTRKVLAFESGHIEFRCSFMHSNMSLRKYLEAMNVEAKKTTLDYNKRRYPDTVLTPEELEYCVNDVRGLVQALRIEMQKDKDNLYTIPLTSTGYIRRPARKSLYAYQKYIKPMLPTYDILLPQKEEFRGGNTHGHRHYAQKILIYDPESEDPYERLPLYGVDISSSYPAQLLRERYPGEFYKRDLKHFEIAVKYRKAFLARIRLYNVNLKNPLWGCPYIAEAKCKIVSYYSDKPKWSQVDNGRVLSAEYIEMTVNEIDFVILESEYTFEYEITELWTARKSYLPDNFRALIMDEYRAKTALKGVDDYVYGKRKGRFNSLYGMMVTNPIKPELKLDDDLMIVEDYQKTPELLVEEYLKNGWLPYQWGIYCTSYARLQLERGLQVIPPEAFIYADTDSIKFVGDYLDRFEELNKHYKIEEYSAEDRHGVRHYIGIFEHDATYKKFVHMGAKKYAYEDMDGKLHITISGVQKAKGAVELGSIENFKPGFTFKEAAGTEAIYWDDTTPQWISVDGHRCLFASGIYIQDSTYTLGEGIDYQKMINFLSNTDIRYSLHYER